MRHYGFMPSSESNTDNIGEVFTLGQNDPRADQTDQEIIDATAAEITRSKKLTKDVKKAAGKKPIPPQGRDCKLTSTDEHDGNDTNSRGHHPKE
jgi:hypothetical protein